MPPDIPNNRGLSQPPPRAKQADDRRLSRASPQVLTLTEYYREVARRVLLKHKALLQMDDEDAGGTRATFLMYENIEGIADAWRDVHFYIIEHHPRLLDDTPSPDNVLRRLREVKKEMKDKGLVQPPI